MIGLASARDTGDTAQCKLSMTKLIEDQVKATPSNRTVPWSVVLMVSMALIGGMSNRADLLRSETHAWTLFSAIAIVTAFRLYMCRTTEGADETSAVKVLSKEAFRTVCSTGFEAVAGLLSIGKTRDDVGSLKDLRKRLVETSGKTFGLIVSTKITWYLTNHHVGTGTAEGWVSYSRKVAETLCGLSMETGMIESSR
eukprot:4136809-Amphidinium_carterae.1